MASRKVKLNQAIGDLRNDLAEVQRELTYPDIPLSPTALLKAAQALRRLVVVGERLARMAHVKGKSPSSQSLSGDGSTKKMVRSKSKTRLSAARTTAAKKDGDKWLKQYAYKSK